VQVARIYWRQGPRAPRASVVTNIVSRLQRAVEVCPDDRFRRIRRRANDDLDAHLAEEPCCSAPDAAVQTAATTTMTIRPTTDALFIPYEGHTKSEHLIQNYGT